MYVSTQIEHPITLTEPAAAMTQPRWRVWLYEALAQLPLTTDAPLVLCETIREGVATAYHPLLKRARAEWRAGVGNTMVVGIDLDRVEGQWIDMLVERLAQLSLRTLVLELQVARLLGHLSGDNPKSRFSTFFLKLGEPQALQSFFDEYPVLAELLVRACRSWVHYGVEVVSHVHEDRSALAATFDLDLAADPLVRLSSTSSDAHRGGRTVLIGETAAGRRLVYKPRSSSLDLHFQQLLRWIARRDDRFEFRTLTVLTIGEHGWIEYVQHEPCLSMDEARCFFRRQGEYLALLYALDGADMHFENVLACGPHPVLVDLEGLFHPSLFNYDDGRAFTKAFEALDTSVLKVGLLPWRIGAERGGPGVDIGGLSAPADQLSPRPVLTAEGLGTDEMYLVRKHEIFGSAGHRASLASGAALDPLDHVNDLEEGFASMYRFLCHHRDALLDSKGPLARFTGDSTRVILRPTSAYALLLQESLHPDLMRVRADRVLFIGHLRGALQHAEGPLRATISAAVESEIADVCNGDIPIFSSGFNIPALIDSRGRQLPGALSESAWQRIHARMQRLGPKDFALQHWILRSSIATLGRADIARPPSSGSASAVVTPMSRSSLQAEARAMARAIGERLNELAYRGNDEVTWLGVNAEALGHWAVGPLQGDLYGGLAGVVLFLAYLADATDDPAPHKLAEAAAASWLHGLEDTNHRERHIGAFVGHGGSLYLITHLAHLWGRSDLLQRARALMGLLPELIDADESFDVVTGSAGCIVSLLGLHRTTGDAQALALAVRCGDRLIARAVPQAIGWGWPSHADRPALGGFSHGAAGISWALSQLADETGLAEYRVAAMQALVYDRSLLDRETENWRDLRLDADMAPDSRLMLPSYWCHGAPGIGLARLAMMDNDDDASLRKDVAIALQTTLNTGFCGNHSLCHGNLGNLELLLQAAARSNIAGDWQFHADNVLARTLAEMRRDGWRCGLPLNVEAPGLMTGLAGLGLGLLRSERPDAIPAVLLLEPPRQRNGVCQ